MLLSCFCSRAVNKGHFTVYLGSHFLHFCVFFLVILLSKIAPISTEVLSAAPKHKKAAMCVMERTRVSHELRSGVSYTVVGWELDAHESTIHIK